METSLSLPGFSDSRPKSGNPYKWVSHGLSRGVFRGALVSV